MQVCRGGNRLGRGTLWRLPRRLPFARRTEVEHTNSQLYASGVTFRNVLLLSFISFSPCLLVSDSRPAPAGVLASPFVQLHRFHPIAPLLRSDPVRLREIGAISRISTTQAAALRRSHRRLEEVCGLYVHRSAFSATHRDAESQSGEMSVSITEILRKTEGLARSRHLYQSGVTPYQLRQALRAGTVRRLRKHWIALPDADALLAAAASRGVVLSCITQARRLGLWVPDPSAIHVAANRGHHINTAGCTVHWSKPAVPRDPAALEDPLENVLLTVARCQPFESALVVWESALNKQLIDLRRLELIPMRGTAASLRQAATPYADSGLETIFRTRLAWLRVPLRTQTWVEGHRVDFLIGERLIVQIDGGHHVGRQREEDIRHDAELLMRGYHVIRLSYHQVMHDWPAVQHLVQSAVARGLHLKRDAR